MIETDVRWLPALTTLVRRGNAECIDRADARYEAARVVFNRLHDLKPAALVRTLDSAVVADVLRFAADHDVQLAVRGGGHHVAGYGSCDGGVVLDFSPFRTVTIEGGGSIVSVDPGARLSDVDRVLNAAGLVIPTGTVSETGIAGLTLGGGIGWLVGKYGLTCDHLVGADVVLADGRIVRAEAPEHEGLLWALKGAGGSFGVVTRFRFRACHLPTVTTGTAEVDIDNDASDTLERVLGFLADECPPELTVAPSFVADATGNQSLAFDFCMVGVDMAPLREFLRVVGPSRRTVRHDDSFVRWQRALDDRFAAPMRTYWKARYGRTLERSSIDALVDVFGSRPCRATILIEHLHGALHDCGVDESAFPLRAARFGVLVSARWTDSALDQVSRRWVREAIARLDPHDALPSYSNYTPDDDAAAAAGRGQVAARLLATKACYDPHNLLARNAVGAVYRADADNAPSRSFARFAGGGTQ